MSTPPAVDEAGAEVSLEVAQVVRYRRHPVLQRLRGARQAPVLPDGEEHTELLQVHHT